MTRSNELLAGLDEKEAASRLEKVGENRLKAKKRRSAVSIFFSQFSDVMIWILLAATGLSFLLGDTPEAITILSLVFLNALLGFLQENKTEKTIEQLISETSKYLSGELLYMKFLQGVPIVGAVGGAYDFVYMNQINTYAKIKYYKRFLTDKMCGL